MTRMSTWSTSPFPRALRLEQLGPLGKDVSQNDGESRRVSHLLDHPGWLLKEYNAPLGGNDAERLQRLVRLPAEMGIADLDLVDRSSAWPTAQVTDEAGTTVGTLLPLAPSGFSSMTRVGPTRTQLRQLEIDLLALTSDEQRSRDLQPQSLQDRLAVCTSITAVASLFERFDLVYLDWSYSNVLWSNVSHVGYVIDVDGTSFGPRLQIESPNWADPLVPRGTLAGMEVDRYRVALLAARCLTGCRGTIEETTDHLIVLGTADRHVEPAADVLRTALLATDPHARPTTTHIHDALRAAHEASGQLPSHSVVRRAPAGPPRPHSAAAATQPPSHPRPEAAPEHAADDLRSFYSLLALVVIVGWVLQLVLR